MKTVCVQGLGFVGSAMCIALASATTSIKSRRFNVVGLDLPNELGQERIDSLNSGKFPFETTDEELSGLLSGAIHSGNFHATADASVLSAADVIVIDVHLDIPFLNHQPKLELGGFKGAISTVARHMQQDALVMVETTVPPGTCEKVVLPILRKGLNDRGLDGDRVNLAHSYERVMPGKEYLKSITNFWRVYSGINEKSALLCEEFLASFINTKSFPLTKLESPRESESAKILENSYRAMNIAFIDEWTKFAEQAGINLLNVLDAVRVRPTHSNIRFPGLGVGGYCLTKDPAFAALGAQELFDLDVKFPFADLTLRTIEKMPAFSADVIEKNLGGQLVDKNILLCGIAYKDSVSDVRYSPSLTLASILKEKKANVVVFDPLCSPNQLPELTWLTKLPEDFSCFDAAIFSVGHDEICSLDLSEVIAPTMDIWIFDLFGVFAADKKEIWKKNGLKIKTLGEGP